MDVEITSSPRSRSSWWQRTWLWPAVMAALVSLVLGGAWLLLNANQRSKNEQIIPVAIRSQVTFPLYYPQPLPVGMYIDKASFSATDQVVTYTVNYDDYKELQVSIQARSSNISPDDYSGDVTFSTSIGKAVIVVMDDRTTAAVFGSKSWVLINATQPIADDVLRSLINSLQPV